MREPSGLKSIPPSRLLAYALANQQDPAQCSYICHSQNNSFSTKHGIKIPEQTSINYPVLFEVIKNRSVVDSMPNKTLALGLFLSTGKENGQGPYVVQSQHSGSQEGCEIETISKSQIRLDINTSNSTFYRLTVAFHLYPRATLVGWLSLHLLVSWIRFSGKFLCGLPIPSCFTQTTWQIKGLFFFFCMCFIK